MEISSIIVDPRIRGHTPAPPTKLFVVSHFVVNDRLAARGSRRGRFNALETKHPYPLFFKRFRRCLPAAGRIRARKNGPFIPVENLGIFGPAGNERNRTFDTRPGRNWLRYTYRYFLRRPRDVSVMFQRYIRPYARICFSLSICDLTISKIILYHSTAFVSITVILRQEEQKCVENLWINITVEVNINLVLFRLSDEFYTSEYNNWLYKYNRSFIPIFSHYTISFFLNSDPNLIINLFLVILFLTRRWLLLDTYPISLSTCYVTITTTLISYVLSTYCPSTNLDLARATRKTRTRIYIPLSAHRPGRWSNEKRPGVRNGEIPLTILLHGSFKLDNNNCIAESVAR